MAQLAFWISFGVVFYVYFGYPLLLVVWRWAAHRPVRKAYAEPHVSLVIAARNERGAIERKIVNCLELDYPQDKLQIIVSLDGPTDGTEVVVQNYAAQGVEVVHSQVHQGKAAALNRAVLVAEGEVIVFADARQLFDPCALRELVANFSDPSVGAVTGDLILLDKRTQEARDGIGLYWRYEKWLRTMESDVHSMLGATGAIYAIRRGLFKQLPEDTLLDDVAIPMRAVLAGKRAIFDRRAIAYDVVCEPGVEYGRKVRTLMGNYQLLAQMPELLLPWRNPVFFQFLSHKVERLLVPYFLTTLFLSNLFLLHGFYALFFALQATWYLLACVGSFISANHSERRTYPHLAVAGKEKRA